MNPRVSRSSALASKATGFPIAKIAAKLAVGYTLDELRNDITGGQTPASFEPTIDYVVTKVPRFAFEKFKQADDRLTTQMKSVGEVMAIGRTFKESLQKALRGLETGVDGFNLKTVDPERIGDELAYPRAERLWYVADAFGVGMTVDEIFEHTKIDRWFLAQIKEIVDTELALETALASRARPATRSRAQADRLLGPAPCPPAEDRPRPRCARAATTLGIRPVYKRVDTCAAEFATRTAYMYSTYEEECEAAADRPQEGDRAGRRARTASARASSSTTAACTRRWRCARTASRRSWSTAIRRPCRPTTTPRTGCTSSRSRSRTCSRSSHIEKPFGVIVQYGGQTPLKLARDLEKNGVPIIGTSPDMIDMAEDRERFQQMLHRRSNLQQPPNRTARTEADAIKAADEIGYPLVVRPSYVLGGRAMEIVHEQRDLERYMREAVKVSNDSPVLLDRFLNDAIEVDVDALCDGTDVVIGGIMEHIEQAGVHSGDSACSLPPFSLSQEIQDELRAADDRDGARAQRGRADERAVRDPERHGVRAGGESARVAHGALTSPRPPAGRSPRSPRAAWSAQSLAAQGITGEVVPPYFSVKEAVFPFIKFPGVDTILGPEMKSTGEVMGVGETFAEAFVKSQLAAGVQPAGAGQGVHQRQEQRQAARDRGGEAAGRSGVHAGRDPRHRGRAGGGRACR